MRIGIVTLPLTNNYGGILQAFALQRAVESLGHEAATFGVRPPASRRGPLWRHMLSLGKRAMQYYLQGKRDEIVYIDPVKCVNYFDNSQPHQRRFIDTYIRLLPVASGTRIMPADAAGVEALIVGSDQVWRPRFMPYPMNAFLDFAEGRGDMPKISYAASIGADRWQYNASQTECARELVQTFSAVSVRESSAVELCRKHLGVEATVVADPTMLLEADDYRIVYRAEPSPEPMPQKPYLAAYVLDRSSHTARIITDAGRALGLEVRYIGRVHKRRLPSIESWLRGIDEAEAVITDSFHGSVFSMIFGKQFVSIGNAGRGMSRFESLFGQYGLTDRLRSTPEGVISAIKSAIDYNTVHAAMAASRAAGLAWLRRSLSTSAS